MRHLSCFGVLLLIPFALTACNPASSGGSKDGPPAFDQSKLEMVIPEMIRLMEAKDYVTLMKTFTPPEDLKKMTTGKTLEESVKEMEPFFPLMLEGLKKAKDIKPTMEDNGNRAVYKIVDKPGQQESVTFVKVDNKWYAGK